MGIHVRLTEDSFLEKRENAVSHLPLLKMFKINTVHKMGFKTDKCDS